MCRNGGTPCTACSDQGRIPDRRPERKFRKLIDAEKNASSSYEGATVLLSHVSFDMKGLVGAATVVGSLQHESGICEQRADADPLQSIASRSFEFIPTE